MGHVHIYVSLEQTDGYPPYETEELDAVHLAEDRYRLEGIPVFAHGLAKGDVVRVVRVYGEDDTLWIAEVLAESGNWTVRVLPWDKKSVADVIDKFRALGCESYEGPLGLVAINVPCVLPAPPLLKALQEGREGKVWDYEVGLGPIEAP